MGCAGAACRRAMTDCYPFILRVSSGVLGMRFARPRKPTWWGAVLTARGAVLRRFGEQVPRPSQSHRHGPCGASPATPDTKARRTAGHENGRSAACTKKVGQVLRASRCGRAVFPGTRASSPWQVGRALRASRQWVAFVTGRRPVSCPAKRGFVSGGSGGDACIARTGDGAGRACTGRYHPLPARPPTAARRDADFRGRA